MDKEVTNIKENKKDSKLKTFFKQIATYFKPISGHGTIGMYQRTIVYSLWVLVICFLLSIFLELFKGNNTFLGFVETYAIGIACSDVVVIVTSITQFKSERGNRIHDYYLLIFNIVSYHVLFLELEEKDPSNRMYKRLLKQISNSFEEFDGFYNTMFWFNNQIEKKSLKVITCVLKIKIRFYTLEKGNIYNVDENEIDELANNAIEFFEIVEPSSKTSNLFSVYLDSKDESQNSS